MLALQREQANGEIFDVGTGLPTTILEMAHAIARKRGIELTFQASHQFRSGDVRHCWADITKIRKRLGFEPKTVFPAGLDDLLNSIGSELGITEVATAHNELAQRGLVREIVPGSNVVGSI